MRNQFALVAVLTGIVSATAYPQSATPTIGVLARVLMVESEYGRGSIFSVDVDNREYWITAKHILTGAEHPPYGSVSMTKVNLRILNPGADGESWLAETFSVIDTEKDVDIVALAPLKPILDNPPASVSADSSGVLFGGDCEFLGFPYGGGWRAKFDNGHSFWMPFIKHCTVSAFPNEGLKVWILDGINNAGFSGGPVVFRTGSDQKIMAVISGYEMEPADVIPSITKPNTGRQKPSQVSTPTPTPHPKEKVNLNSGFIIAYDISYAIAAIHAKPIGPLRPAP